MGQQTSSRFAISRRGFLAASVAASFGAPQVVRAETLGKGGGVAASERVGFGVIGVGSRGNDHVRTFAGYPGAEIVALCDPYKSKCEAAGKALQERLAGQGIKREPPAMYQDFRDCWRATMLTRS